jgi:hypothetical protein
VKKLRYKLKALKTNEITAGNFPNLGEDMNNQVQEAFRTLNRHEQKESLHVNKKTEQRNNIESWKREIPSYLERQVHQNYLKTFSRNQKTVE